MSDLKELARLSAHVAQSLYALAYQTAPPSAASETGYDESRIGDSHPYKPPLGLCAICGVQKALHIGGTKADAPAASTRQQGDDLIAAERSSAREAWDVLSKALGWSSGGLGSAAIEIVKQRDEARRGQGRGEVVAEGIVRCPYKNIAADVLLASAYDDGDTQQFTTDADLTKLNGQRVVVSVRAADAEGTARSQVGSGKEGE